MEVLLVAVLAQQGLQEEGQPFLVLSVLLYVAVRLLQRFYVLLPELLCKRLEHLCKCLVVDLQHCCTLLLLQVPLYVPRLIQALLLVLQRLLLPLLFCN